MKPYIGVWTSKNEMLQIGYRKALKFYAKCGITTIIVGYEGAHLQNIIVGLGKLLQ